MQEEKEFKMVSTSWMLPGVTCWVLQSSDQKKDPGQDDNAYVRGIIISLTANRLNARMTYPEEKGPEEVPVQFVFEANQDYENYKQGWDDMVQMNVLNEAEIIANVKLRYKKDIIFTYIGPTLIVMNPYKLIKTSFSPDVLELYQNQLFASESFDMRDCPPHVYAISAQAYSQMFRIQKNQAIVISGESGAGKTENAKYAMKFLTSLSSIKSQQLNVGEVPIEDKILSCNPILEAFGNAKTVRNDNSSRFGKYVRIWVLKQSRKIIGASVANYLLEKSRVTQLAQGERNYHIFYFMLKGLTNDQLNNLQLCDEAKKPLPMSKFEYLNQSGCTEVESLPDKVLHQEVMQSFSTMKFSSDEVDGIFRVISGVLLLGNLQFDGSTLTDSDPCSVKNGAWLTRVSKALQIEEQAIANAIFLKTREVGKQVMKSPNSLDECGSICVSLSRALYDKLFNWLVKKLNQTIIPSDMDEISQTLAIGLLDIFGFENFQVNSFEQLCINFTNEKLQQLYISYVFKSEEQEFRKEGLQEYLQQLKYNDNQPIIDLIDKYPLGIFDLLDESCSLASATEEQLIVKIAKTHAEHAHFRVPKLVKEKFSIVHTPKEVTYMIAGFRGKNKDEISKDLERGVTSSANESIVRFWRCLLEDEKADDSPTKGSTKENKFLSAKFRKQMKDLMEELQSCDVHFIRCIKPNEIKKKDFYLNSYVLLQIRYLGILESVKVRKEGYPIRSEYNNFYTRYHELDMINRRIQLKRHTEMGSDMKGLVREIVNRVFPKLDKKIVLYGNSKIYMKMDVAYKLDRLLQEWWKYKGEKASLIQRAYRRHLVRKRIIAGLKKIHHFCLQIKKLQALVRMHQARKRYLMKKKSIAISKRLLIRIHRKCLKRNFDNFRVNSSTRPKTQKSPAMILQRKFLPCMDKYHKRMALWKWRERAKLMGPHQPMQYDHQAQFQQYASQVQQQEEEIDYSELMLKFESEIKHINNQLDLGYQPEVQEPEEDIEDQPDFEIPTDHFEVDGLRIWSFEQFLIVSPLVTAYLKQHAQRKQNAAQEFFNGSQKYTEVNQAWKEGIKYNAIKKNLKLPSVPLLEMGTYQTTSERLGGGDYDADFMEQVRDSNFFLFCDQNIYKGSNFPPDYKIAQMMSFSVMYLRQPLLLIHSHYQDALRINRCMLKIAGVKRSRFTKEFLQELILVSLLGANCILPLPPPPEAYTNANYEKKYQQLSFYKEKKIEQLQPGYRAFQAVNETKQREDTMVVYKTYVNLIRNKYANNIQEWQKDNQLQTGLSMLRDEAYLQICRLLYENPNVKCAWQLYKFACILSYLIGPTKKTIFAVLNFFLDRMENEIDENNKYFSRIIFNNLARQAIQLNVLFYMDEIRQLVPQQLKPNMWGKSYVHVSEQIPISLIKKLKLYKRDPITERLARIATGLDSLYDMCLSAFSITSGRLLLPSWPERIYISQRKQLLFRVSLANEAIVWVPIDPMNTLREMRNTLLSQIGLEKLQQYFAFYQTVEINNREKEGFWCHDACKVLDLTTKEVGDMEVYDEQYKRRIVIKLYLKIRVFYPVRKEDHLSAEFMYHQLVLQVLKGELPIGVEKAISLGALQLYIEVKQSQSPDQWPTQETLCERINCFIPETLVTGVWQNARAKQHNDRQQTFKIDDWSRRLTRAASKLEFEKVEDAKWLYINVLRTQDLFLAQQVKCSFHVVPKGNFGVLRRKRFLPGFLGIRPSHLVLVDWPSRHTFRIIPYEEITQWGRAVGTDSLMYVRQKTNEVVFLQMGEEGMQQMEYLINAYMNWEQCLPLDAHLTAINFNLYSTLKEGEIDQSYAVDNSQNLYGDFQQESQFFSQYNQYDLESNAPAEEFQYGQYAGYNYDF